MRLLILVIALVFISCEIEDSNINLPDTFYEDSMIEIEFMTKLEAMTNTQQFAIGIEWGICADIDTSGLVDQKDIDIFMDGFAQEPYECIGCRIDITENDTVDINDFLVLNTQMGWKFKYVRPYLNLLHTYSVGDSAGFTGQVQSFIRGTQKNGEIYVLDSYLIDSTTIEINGGLNSYLGRHELDGITTEISKQGFGFRQYPFQVSNLNHLGKISLRGIKAWPEQCPLPDDWPIAPEDWFQGFHYDPFTVGETVYEKSVIWGLANTYVGDVILTDTVRASLVRNESCAANGDGTIYDEGLTTPSGLEEHTSKFYAVRYY